MTRPSGSTAFGSGAFLHPAAAWAFTLLKAASLAALFFALAAFIRHSRGRPMPPATGVSTPRRVIPAPHFAQADPRWADAAMGPRAADTLGAAGCAVASAAMILAGYGIDTDPARLNTFLNASEGYTERAWLHWHKAAEFARGFAVHAYEGPPSARLIDRNLDLGNPVIVRVRLPSGLTHFVVIAGKQGRDYLVLDPASWHPGVRPLAGFGTPVEALRFFAPK